MVEMETLWVIYWKMNEGDTPTPIGFYKNRLVADKRLEHFQEAHPSQEFYIGGAETDIFNFKEDGSYSVLSSVNF